jgi:hypothetical protein
MSLMTAIAPALFLVIEDDFLVAQDIFESIRQFRPGAKVVTLSPREAREGVARGDRAIAVAFASMPVADLVDSGLGAAIAARGAKIVVLCDDAADAAEAAAMGWAAVLRPFASEDLRCFIPGP